MTTVNRKLTTIFGFLALVGVFITAVSFTLDAAAKQGLDLFKVVATNDLNGYALLWGYNPLMHIVLIVIGCIVVFGLYTSRK